MKYITRRLPFMCMLTLVTVLLCAPAYAAGTTVYLPMTMGGAGTSTSVPTATPTTRSPAGAMDMRREVIRLVNVERAKVGCPATIENTDLMNGAQAWSDYLETLTTGIAHTDTVDAQWYLHHGYSLSSGEQENIAGPYPTPADVVAAWMSDAGHRNAILFCPIDPVSHDFEYPNYDIGVGYDPGSWTMAIGSR